jgi:hypothetical protein
MIMMNPAQRLLHPELPQVNPRKSGFFEGWYYKLIDRTTRNALAIIPGIAAGENGHAFVQYINPAQGHTEYFRFPLQEFYTGTKPLQIRIGENEFRRDGIALNLSNGSRCIKGTLFFTDILPFPSTALRPGIMGPFGFVPGMECYHGIVNITERLHGSLCIDGQSVDFEGGSGYVEKDWGRSFPEAWVWLQSNHFSRNTACFLFSLGIIPSPFGSFPGFFTFLHLNGRLHLFATYTGAHIDRLEYDGKTLHAAVTSRSGSLRFTASAGATGLLAAPKNGLMNRMIEESISAEIEVCLTDGQGTVLFEDSGGNCGMECCDVQKLLERFPF